MRDQSGLVWKQAECPEEGCDGVYRWREQSGIRRFQPKAKVCPECGNAWR